MSNKKTIIDPIVIQNINKYLDHNSVLYSLISEYNEFNALNWDSMKYTNGKNYVYVHNLAEI